MQERRLTPGLLLLSICIVLLLMPGGPIENRVFPVPLFVAACLGLHAFILSICAAFSVYQTRRGGRQALYLAALEAIGFATIYLADMSGVVPSAEPMGDVVKVFSIIGLAVAVLLMASVVRDLRRPMPEMESHYGMSRGEIVSLMAFSLYVGVILTIISTFNTVSRHPALYVWYGIH